MNWNTQKAIDLVSDYRGLPNIRKNQRCEVDGRKGKIIGENSSANLNVLFDGDKRPSNCHSYFKMKIFANNGELIYQSSEDQ